jgi:hypothetical protein
MSISVIVSQLNVSVIFPREYLLERSILQAALNYTMVAAIMLATHKQQNNISTETPLNQPLNPSAILNIPPTLQYETYPYESGVLPPHEIQLANSPVQTVVEPQGSYIKSGPSLVGF